MAPCSLNSAPLKQLKFDIKKNSSISTFPLRQKITLGCICLLDAKDIVVSTTNGRRINVDIMTGENCQFSLLIGNSFIGQFVHPLVEWR